MKNTPSPRTYRTVGLLLPLFCLLALPLCACWRDFPPEIQQFRAPAEAPEDPIAVEPDTSAAPVAEAPQPEPEPEVTSQPVKAPVLAEAPKETQTPADATKAPTIIGTWRMESVTQNCRQEQMPPGMDMLLTFNEDGTTTTSMSMQGQSHERSGTYTLTGDQLSISIDGHTQTGTITFSGNDRLSLEMQQGGMQATVTLTRA